ncbi:hypothetical protein HDV57DRAFT_505255 [Trichoderma longibrachiatum]
MPHYPLYHIAYGGSLRRITGSRPTLFSLGHPAYHQQGPQAAVIGSSSLDQSFSPMMCSPSALAQHSVLGRTKKMPRCAWMATPREVYTHEPCAVSL